MRATIPHKHPAVMALTGFVMLMMTACQLMPGNGSGNGPAVAADNDQDGAADALTEALAPVWIVAPVRVPVIAHKSLPPPPPDLWADIRGDFAMDHSLTRRRVQQELRWLKRHPQYLPRLQSRMQRYLPYIHSQVQARGLPGELALLPIVESALDPYAFSHGGAAGLWQFIPGTADHFGLPRNWWVDGRRDPVLATDAALNFLQHLHSRLDDWNLAVAGYNAGEGNVRRALRRADGATAFWDLDLPRETRAYVPRLLALAAVVADPGAYGIELPELRPEPAFATIEIHSQFDLMKAASALELSLDAVYEWNPALNQWATPPEGPHHLHVPIELAEHAQQRIDAVPDDQRVQWLRIEVRSGDTLSHIARRHHTDVATLKRVNELRGTRIRAGQALFIPKSRDAIATYPSNRGPDKGDYLVKPGDSLWSIARAHGVPLSRLIKTNQIGPKEVLRVGQRLNVPGATSSAATTASLPSHSRDVTRKVRYGVRRGDSLARIASKFNVAVRDLVQWNQLDIGNYLQPGQKLLIYVNVAAGE